jgi:hypothetical protein
LCLQTHISNEIDEIAALIATRIPFPAKDLKNKNPKAEYIRLDRENALRSILRGHVATAMIKKTCQYY